MQSLSFSTRKKISKKEKTKYEHGSWKKSRKLIGEILFMANSNVKRIYNIILCVVCCLFLSWFVANPLKNHMYHINRCLRIFRYRFHKIKWTCSFQSSSDQCNLFAISAPPCIVEKYRDDRQQKNRIKCECGCFFWRECENTFCKQSNKFQRPVSFWQHTHQFIKCNCVSFSF